MSRAISFDGDLVLESAFSICQFSSLWVLNGSELSEDIRAIESLNCSFVFVG